MTTRKFARVKLPGARCLEIDLASIQAFQVEFSDDEGEYILVATTSVCQFIACRGRLDECHHLLNQLNAEMDSKIIDIK